MEAQEILQDIFFVILYGVVMGLSVAAALYLLLRRSNAIAPLGLSICRDIAGRLGGQVWLDTAYTPGARFVFTVPAEG